MAGTQYDSVMLVMNDFLHDGHTHREAATLAEAGWRVLVVGTQRADGKLPDREMISGFEVWRVRYGRFGDRLWRPWRWIRHALQAVQIIRTIYPLSTRVYHAHDLPAMILLSCLRALRRHPAPLIYDVHNIYLFQMRYTSRLVQVWHSATRPLFMRIEAALARRANAVTTLSEPAARAMMRWYGFPRPVVIHNTVDLADETAVAPFDLRALVGSGRRCVIHSGDIADKRRSLSELVRAVAQLPDDVALVFVGRGESIPDLKQLAKDLQIEDRVFFVPAVAPEQVAAVIRQADAAAVLMRPGSWNTRAQPPNKLFEAVAAGLPVVASNVFVLRRIIRQYPVGVICSPTDPDAIAAALAQVLSAEAQVYYREQVRAAQAVLNWQVDARKLCALYETILL
jgi:glycosyltransferase involved in cell wall biosynthesis